MRARWRRPRRGRQLTTRTVRPSLLACERRRTDKLAVARACVPCQASRSAARTRCALRSWRTPARHGLKAQVTSASLRLSTPRVHRRAATSTWTSSAWSATATGATSCGTPRGAQRTALLVCTVSFASDVASCAAVAQLRDDEPGRRLCAHRQAGRRVVPARCAVRSLAALLPARTPRRLTRMTALRTAGS